MYLGWNEGPDKQLLATQVCQIQLLNRSRGALRVLILDKPVALALPQSVCGHLGGEDAAKLFKGLMQYLVAHPVWVEVLQGTRALQSGLWAVSSSRLLCSQLLTLAKTLPTPDLRAEGSRCEGMSRTDRPHISVWLSVSSALVAASVMSRLTPHYASCQAMHVHFCVSRF